MTGSRSHGCNDVASVDGTDKSEPLILVRLRARGRQDTPRQGEVADGKCEDGSARLLLNSVNTGLCLTELV